MKGFILGLIVGLVAVPLLVFIYFSQGMAPVATDAPPMPFERYLARVALRTHIEREMPQGPPPMQATDDNLIAGAKVYMQSCIGCHGKMDSEPDQFAKGLFPHPPRLLSSTRTVKVPPGALYWVITNGVRLSAMPSFRDMLSDQERWQVALMLVNAQKLPTAAQGLVK
jgi:thiosulfate dehydrogenase